MPVSLATVTPPVMTLARVHEVKRGLRVGWRCAAKGCSFVTEEFPSALRHTTQNQWVATPNLPKELQLTPEQEA